MNSSSLSVALVLCSSVVLLFLPQLHCAVCGVRQPHKHSPLLGGYRPIKNLANPRVVSLAKFAVDTHNKRTNTGLVYVNVTGGEWQEVTGTNFRLRIEARKGTYVNTYEAVVFTPLRGHPDLKSFDRFVCKPRPSWLPVRSDRDPHLVEVAQYAVETFNNRANSALVYDEVIDGQRMEVRGGTKYKLRIAARKSDASINYEVVVLETYDGSKILVSIQKS